MTTSNSFADPVLNDIAEDVQQLRSIILVQDSVSNPKQSNIAGNSQQVQNCEDKLGKMTEKLREDVMKLSNSPFYQSSSADYGFDDAQIAALREYYQAIRKLNDNTDDEVAAANAKEKLLAVGRLLDPEATAIREEEMRKDAEMAKVKQNKELDDNVDVASKLRVSDRLARMLKLAKQCQDDDENEDEKWLNSDIEALDCDSKEDTLDDIDEEMHDQADENSDEDMYDEADEEARIKAQDMGSDEDMVDEATEAEDDDKDVDEDLEEEPAVKHEADD